jgi:hypothetical protein
VGGQQAATPVIGYQIGAADLLTVINAANRQPAQQPPKYFVAKNERYDNQQSCCGTAA